MACALAMQHICRLIAALPNGAGRLDEEEALSPHHLDAFLHARLRRITRPVVLNRNGANSPSCCLRYKPPGRADKRCSRKMPFVPRVTLKRWSISLRSISSLTVTPRFAHERPLLTTGCSKPGSRAAICWHGGSTSFLRQIRLAKRELMVEK